MRRARVVGECVLRATGERLFPKRELEMEEDVAVRLRDAGCVVFLHATPPPAAEALAPGDPGAAGEPGPEAEEPAPAEPAPAEPAPAPSLTKPKRAGRKPKGEA